MPEKESVYNLRNRSVKRMLWPVDHVQIKVDLSREKQKGQKEMTEKYNFDFSTGKPLRGRYNWVRIGCESPTSSPCLMEEKEPRCSRSMSTTQTCRRNSPDSKKQKTKKITKENKNTTTNKRSRAVKPVNKSRNSPLKSTYVLRTVKRHSSRIKK